MYTLDANVFNRNVDHRDPAYAVCHTLLEHLQATQQRIVVPTLILAEIAGPISRFYRDPVRARLYADSVAAFPKLILRTVDEALARFAAELAADYALRGMDAIYVAVARQYGCPLVTLDDEIRRRAGMIITVQTPTEVLNILPPP
jgi:predicted nucleic acid-binding protein